MDISKSENYRGIVIACKSDAKSGKILDIYTVEAGRIKAYVRSAYDLRSNTSRSSFIFTESLFTLSNYKEIYLVNDSKVLYAPKLIDSDLRKIHDFAFLSELLVTMLNTHESDERIYKMLITLLNVMDIYPERAKLFILTFILKLLYFLGYFPQIRITDTEAYSFNYIDGIIKPSIANYAKNTLSSDEVETISILLEKKFVEFIDTYFADASIDNLMTIFINYILYIFDKEEFKTLKVKYWGGQNVFSRFNDETT